MGTRNVYFNTSDLDHIEKMEETTIAFKNGEISMEEAKATMGVEEFAALYPTEFIEQSQIIIATPEERAHDQGVSVSY